MDVKFLELPEILDIHDVLIKIYSGSFGVRNMGLLDSALNVPSSGHGTAYFHPDLYEMAAAYAYHLIKNHPFVDGNKRTGIAAMIVFLKLNGIQINMSDRTGIKLGVDIAVDKVNKNQIAEILRKHTISI